MIIVGDIACPTAEHSDHLRKTLSKYSVFNRNTVICNLEGLINDTQSLNDEKPILFNHTSVVNVFNEFNVKVVGLANNHILDLPKDYQNTIHILEASNIQHSGSGKTKTQASQPVLFKDGINEVILISSCWDFLLYNQKNPTAEVYINTIDENEILHQVVESRLKKENAIILVYLHWSFDLETLPFPMYRQWSRALIDAGADLVIGCHSHCVQGGEAYKDGYIVYGLGNFYIPNNTFANGKLAFPEFASTQLAFEYDIESKKAYCHWFKYQNDHTISHISSDLFKESEMLNKYSPYANMNEKEYLLFYKKHRRKKKMVPVFSDYKSVEWNKLKVAFLKKRAKVARFLAERQFIKWQN